MDSRRSMRSWGSPARAVDAGSFLIRGTATLETVNGVRMSTSRQRRHNVGLGLRNHGLLHAMHAGFV